MCLAAATRIVEYLQQVCDPPGKHTWNCRCRRCCQKEIDRQISHRGGLQRRFARAAALNAERPSALTGRSQRETVARSSTLRLDNDFSPGGNTSHCIACIDDQIEGPHKAGIIHIIVVRNDESRVEIVAEEFRLPRHRAAPCQMWEFPCLGNYRYPRIIVVDCSAFVF